MFSYLFSWRNFFAIPIGPIKADTSAVLCPADGRVVHVGKASSPLSCQEKTIKISIFMNVFNVHVNRVPVDGYVTKSEHHTGKFFNAVLDKASHENERHLIRLSTAYGEVLCVQIAGLIARRVLCLR